MSSTVGSFNLYAGQRRGMTKVLIGLEDSEIFLTNKKYLVHETQFLFNHPELLEPFFSISEWYNPQTPFL